MFLAGSLPDSLPRLVQTGLDITGRVRLPNFGLAQVPSDPAALNFHFQLVYSYRECPPPSSARAAGSDWVHAHNDSTSRPGVELPISTLTSLKREMSQTAASENRPRISSGGILLMGSKKVAPRFDICMSLFCQVLELGPPKGLSA